MDRLISEQKVLKTIDNLKANFTCYDSVTLDEVASHVQAIPSAEPKTGHWIDDGFYAEGHSHKAFHCSKCGHNVLGFKENLSNYCPNCGAKMIEPQERSENVT